MGRTFACLPQKLLPSDEFEWLKVQRSRPLAVLSQLRRLIYRECEAGRLSQQMQYILDIDIKELNGVHSSCERLFTSPIPPNMARHGMRSLTLWLCALPVVLVGQLPPLSIATWAITTSYIYIGIDELGAQVLYQYCRSFSSFPINRLISLSHLHAQPHTNDPSVEEMATFQTKCATLIPTGGAAIPYHAIMAVVPLVPTQCRGGPLFARDATLQAQAIEGEASATPLNKHHLARTER